MDDACQVALMAALFLEKLRADMVEDWELLQLMGDKITIYVKFYVKDKRNSISGTCIHTSTSVLHSFSVALN